MIFDRAAEKVCRGCALCELCWQKEYTGTFNALNDATPYLMERGRALAKDFPGYFTDRCIHLPDFLTAVNGELSAFLLRRQYRRQLEETRRSARGQYAQLSELLTATAAGLGEVRATAGEKAECRIGAALRPKAGETVCGDTVVSFRTESGLLCLLLADGIAEGFVVGAKKPPVRAVAEPPTGVAVKGPREGFIEDVKTNMSLVRKRLKSPALRFEMLKAGRRSETNIAVCWLEGIADAEVREEVSRKIGAIDIDYIPDSSYIADFLSPEKHSVFRRVGTTEKPDVFAAKLAEGRVGILVDGSPIALTAPFLFLEDLQSAEDYYVSPFMASVFRAIRFFAALVSLLLPAFYVCSQLFKTQLLPLGLTLTIASGIQGLPLSPSMEMFLLLLVLEVLKEASIRMPRYVGMSLSVVGALVLGEAAVSAGFVSTPAIIIVAFSGICLYTVPDFVEAGSILRWLYLLVAGSLGPFGIVLLSAFLLYYLLSAEAFGTPLLAPFSPLVPHDLKDSVVKYGIQSLTERPRIFRPKNRVRLSAKNPCGEKGKGKKSDAEKGGIEKTDDGQGGKTR